jgi:hypothetical protein
MAILLTLKSTLKLHIFFARLLWSVLIDTYFVPHIPIWSKYVLIKSFCDFGHFRTIVNFIVFKGHNYFCEQIAIIVGVKNFQILPILCRKHYHYIPTYTTLTPRTTPSQWSCTTCSTPTSTSGKPTSPQPTSQKVHMFSNRDFVQLSFCALLHMPTYLCTYECICVGEEGPFHQGDQNGRFLPIC